MLSLLLLTLAALPEVAPPESVELSAERVLRDGAQRRLTGEGHARLRATDAAIDADRIVYDEALSAATASGNVLMRLTSNGLIAITAEVVSVRFEGGQVTEVFLHEGQAVRKQGTSAQELLAASTPQALAAAGQVSMLLTSSHLKRTGSGAWEVDGLGIVPCECNFAEPSWQLRSARATLDLEAERATLLFPTVRVFEVPVLWLPWLSLPLTSRQTGLLFPAPNFTGLNGFQLELPVFVTLGRSADLTFTPGAFFGGRNPSAGVQGPRLLTELRYAPAQGTSGRLALGLLYDFKAPRDPFNPALLQAAARRGLRFDLVAQHVQELGSGWFARLDASVVSDGDFVRDFTPDLLAREAQYLRSAAVLARRTEGTWLGVDAVLRQDVQFGYPVLGLVPAPTLPGTEAPRFGPNPLHRLPALQFAIPQRPLWGPLAWSLGVGFVRLAPTEGRTGDEGADAREGVASAQVAGVEQPITLECLQARLFFPASRAAAACPIEALPNQKATMGDRVYQPGEREARDRFEVLPRLSANFRPGGLLSITPSASWRQAAWIGEQTGRTAQRGYPLLGLAVETELSRTFGEGEGALRHSLTPVLEARWIPVVLGNPPAAYDEVDAALPDSQRRLQAVLELRQRLTTRVNGAVLELLRLELGQGLELISGATARVAESYARASTRLRWLSAFAAARAQLAGPRPALTRLSAGLALEAGAGRSLYASYENLLDDGSDRMRQPIELLFGPPPALTTAGRAQLLTFGGRYAFRAFSFRYDALFTPKLDYSAVAAGVPTPGLDFAQHGVGLGWAPACDCFRLELTATQRRLGPTSPLFRVPDFGATLTVSGFGTIGRAN